MNRPNNIFIFPDVRILSRANKTEHWAKRRKRESGQRFEVRIHSRQIRQLSLPVAVRMTRFAPQAMDGDNLISAFKHIRDELANILIPEKTQGNQFARWADDSDNRIAWEVAQVQSSSWSMQIEITENGEETIEVEETGPE